MCRYQKLENQDTLLQFLRAELLTLLYWARFRNLQGDMGYSDVARAEAETIQKGCDTIALLPTSCRASIISNAGSFAFCWSVSKQLTPATYKRY